MTGESAGWMEPIDEELLRAFDETPWMGVKQLATHLGWDRGLVEQRCRLLSEANLLAEVYHDAYHPTPIGEAYLQGALKVETLTSPPTAAELSGRAGCPKSP